MRNILTVLLTFLSLNLFSQNLDTVKVEETKLDLHLDMYKFNYPSTLNYTLGYTTPYLYLIGRDNFPFENDPTPYPKNFNPYGVGFIYTGSIKILLKK